MPRKRLSKKRGPANAAFQALQRKWDKKLKASGFKDIEQGKDFNRIEASTMQNGAGGWEDPKHRRRIVVSFDDAILPDNVSFLGGTDRYNFWNCAAQAAHALPKNRKYRNLFQEIANTGNVAQSCRKLGIDPDEGRRAWHVFLRDDAGLPFRDPNHL